MVAMPGTGPALRRSSPRKLSESTPVSEADWLWLEASSVPPCVPSFPARPVPPLVLILPLPMQITTEEWCSGMFGNMNFVFSYVRQNWKFTSHPSRWQSLFQDPKRFVLGPAPSLQLLLAESSCQD